MAKTRRFEFSKGASNKFWEIRVDGSAHTVTYGRIGTPGQTKTKDMGSPAKARDAAEKLIASKVKKGYVETKATKKSATKKSATKKSAKVSSSAKLVRATSERYPKGAFISVWEDGKDLWIIGCDHADKPDDVSQRDMLDSDGFVQRLRFASPKDAKTAAAAIKKQKKPKSAKVPDWVEIVPSELEKLMKAKDVPTIARFEPAKSGPVTLTRTTTFDWVHPRPASQCGCGRELMPTYQVSGAIDRRLGKVRMYVSFCPGSLQTPYCEGTIEVLMQPEGAKSTDVIAYGLGTGRSASYYVVARSLLWNPIGSDFQYAVTTHFGEKGSPGTVRTKTFRKKKDADAYFKEHSPSKTVSPSKLGKWYRDLLAERAQFHRVPGAKPLTLKLKPSIPPAMISGSPYSRPAGLFDHYDPFGGQPNYTQSDWSRTFECPSCGKGMLFLFQTGSGAAWWAEQLNDGDAGSFQFFACPHCKSPDGRALFECH